MHPNWTTQMIFRHWFWCAATDDYQRGTRQPNKNLLPPVLHTDTHMPLPSCSYLHACDWACFLFSIHARRIIESGQTYFCFMFLQINFCFMHPSLHCANQGFNLLTSLLKALSCIGWPYQRPHMRQRRQHNAPLQWLHCSLAQWSETHIKKICVLPVG